MSEQAYGFAVIGYIHDPLRAESLNIGVAVSDPAGDDSAVLFVESHERLAKVFYGFDEIAFAMLRKSTVARLSNLNRIVGELGFKEGMEQVFRDDENGARVVFVGAAIGSSAAEVASECLKRYVRGNEEIFEFSAKLTLDQIIRRESYLAEASNDAEAISAWRVDEGVRRLAQIA